MARLTSNQHEALVAVVKGKVPGYLLDRTIPSLIKRGLVVKTIRELSDIERTPRKSRLGGFITPMPTVVEFKLTQKGHDLYVKLRTQGFEDKKASLEKEFENDLWRAKMRLLQEEDT